jgi:curved DNA-binding protein CbpA
VTTYYQILGVTPDATADEIRRAYLALAVTNHPDKGGSADRFAPIATAYSKLKTVEERSNYDVELRLTRNVCGTCRGAGRTQFQVSFTVIEKQLCERCEGAGFL